MAMLKAAIIRPGSMPMVHAALLPEPTPKPARTKSPGGTAPSSISSESETELDWWIVQVYIYIQLSYPLRP